MAKLRQDDRGAVAKKLDNLHYGWRSAEILLSLH